MKCEEIVPRIGALVDGEVDAREKTLLLEHVRACPKCVREYEAQKWVKRELAAVPRETASEFLKTRVMAAIRTKPAKAPSFVLRLSGPVAALVVLAVLAVGVVGHVGGRQSAQTGLAGVVYKSLPSDTGTQAASSDNDIVQFAMDTHSNAEAKFQSDSYVNSPDIHLVDETMSAGR